MEIKISTNENLTPFDLEAIETIVIATLKNSILKKGYENANCKLKDFKHKSLFYHMEKFAYEVAGTIYYIGDKSIKQERFEKAINHITQEVLFDLEEIKEKND
jgi:hypothetical protein